MFKSKELLEERGKLIKQSRDILSEAHYEKRELTAEEDARVDEIHKDADRMKLEADKLEAQEKREQSQAEEEEKRRRKAHAERTAYVSKDERAKFESRAFVQWIRGGIDSCDAEQRQYMATRHAQATPEVRAQAAGTDAAGGYLVPEGFSGEIERSMLAFGGMREASRIVRTNSGNDLPWPTVNDTGNSGAILSENTQVAEQDITFASVTYGAYMYTSKLVRVSFQLMQDSAFDMGAFLSSALGERLARATNAHYTTGTGSSQPNGAVTAAGDSGVDIDLSDTTKVEDLVDIYHALDPAYRMNARWMMHDDMLALIRKITLITGTTVTPEWAWQPGLAPGAPDTILGKPYTINQDIPQPTNGNKGLLFGDFSKYIIRDVIGGQLLRLNERYADYLQVGFIYYMRTDGDLLDAGTDPIVYADVVT
jgi:HK97 family phage major capsid protein